MAIMSRFEPRAARISRKNQEIYEKIGDLVLDEPDPPRSDPRLCCGEVLILDRSTGRHECRLCGASPY